MHALRNVRRLLAPGGRVLDLQPLPPGAQAEAGGEVLGRANQEVAFGRFAEVERAVQAVLAGGDVFAVERELEFDVLALFHSAEHLPERVKDWDSELDDALMARLLAAPPPILFRDRVRLRVLRQP